MALHGGVSPELVQKCTAKAGKFSSCLDKKTGDSTVWADPHDGRGFIPSGRGPSVKMFGMDIARDFLMSNNLKGIFRGHEQVDEGYSRMTSGKDYFVSTVFSAADYVGLFCNNDENRPAWDRRMFSFGGVGNDGAVVFADLRDGDITPIRIPASDTRKYAAGFTGAQCDREFSLMERSAEPEDTLEGYMRQNHQDLDHVNHSCSLGQTEKDSLKKQVRKTLTTSKNKEFEARKLIDLQGEALVHGESAEICKSIEKDKITLEVYNELVGTDEETLENDIITRENELEADVDAEVDAV